jgi:nicotinate-nucleotide adenylyltransferase
MIRSSPSVKKNNILYWQNIDDGEYIYSVEITPGNYTIDTLTYLQEKYPQHQFYVIMGGDSFQNLPKWKNFEALIKNYQFIVYRRPGFDITDDYGANMQYLEAPMLELSATLIRNNCKDGITIKYLVPEDVRLEIERCNFFKEEGAKATDEKNKY